MTEANLAALEYHLARAPASSSATTSTASEAWTELDLNPVRDREASKYQLSQANLATLEYQLENPEALVSSSGMTGAAPEASNHLDLNPVQEHKLPDLSSTLQDSKHATSPRRLYTKLPFKHSTYIPSPRSTRKRNTGRSVNKPDNPKRQPTLTTVQQEVLDKIAARKARLAREDLGEIPKATTFDAHLDQMAPRDPWHRRITRTPSTSSTHEDKTVEKLFDMSTMMHDDAVAKFKAQAAAREMAKENEEMARENEDAVPELPTIRKSSARTITATLPFLPTSRKPSARETTGADEKEASITKP